MEPEQTPVELTDHERAYLAFHAPRYLYLVDRVRECLESRDGAVLDVGASPATDVLRESLGVRIDTLGFGEESDAPDRRHFVYDLNLAQNRSAWRTDMPMYDVVIFAEVIEHLYTAPVLVLRFLRTLLEDGGFLVIQTPNAAAISKRIKLLLGRNPYELIREDTTNPGHFREYTAAELMGICEVAGFEVARADLVEYFDSRYAHGLPTRRQRVLGSVRNVVARALPPSMRTGLTLVLRALPNS